MFRLKFVLSFLIAIVFKTTFATTWNEPWAEQVIKEADSFVLAKIKSCNENKGVTIEIIKSLAGLELSGKIEIANFYSLELTSMSPGHGLEFNFEKISTSYFFIKKNKKGMYCIATPTTGFDQVKDGKVYATYRHSYHQALVPIDIYEKTMTAIFKNYHGEVYDKDYINEYVNTYLAMKPAGFDEAEIDVFFAQHVALECAYHLRLTGLYTLVLPFIQSTNFHSQVSAARALISYNTNECKEVLVNIIVDTTSTDFLKVICIWTLTEFKPKELKEQLIKIEATASEDGDGFGGNIMDPRVGTEFPTVKYALETLIKKL